MTKQKTVNSLILWIYFEKGQKNGFEIRYVATVFSAVFVSFVSENGPEVIHVFNHFCVTKLMNARLYEIRKVLYIWIRTSTNGKC